MKKIKLFNYLIIALLLFYLFEFGSRVYYLSTAVTSEDFKKSYELGIFGYYQPFIETFFILLFLIGLFLVQRAILYIIKKDFFNSRSNSLFRRGGLLLIIFGFCNFFMNLEPFFIFENIDFVSNFPKHDFLVFLIGLS